MRDNSLKRPAPATDATGKWADDFDRQVPRARGVLTPEEIAALLRPNLPDDLRELSEPEDIRERADLLFDEDVPGPAEDAERRDWADRAAKLSLALGRSAGIKAAINLRSGEATDHADLVSRLSGSAGAVACFGTEDCAAEILVCLSPELADAMIAAACGAQGSTGRIGERWQLSAIDCALLEQLLSGLGSAFGTGLSLQALETDLAYMTSLMPRGEVYVADYDVTAAGLRSGLTIISARSSTPQVDEPLLAHDRTPVTAVVTARIASLSVPLSRLTSLKAGSTLLLGLPPDQPVEVLSGGRDGKVLFEGDVGRKGDRMAVRISRKSR